MMIMSPSSSPFRAIIGSVQITAVYDGYSVVNADTTIVRPGRPDAWDQYRGELDGGDRLTLPMGGFLVEDGDRRLLIDTGLGPVDTAAEGGGELLRSLNVLGVDADDITDVLFTHLHSDHTGWATRAGRPVFRTATYRVHEAELRGRPLRDSALAGAAAQTEVIRHDGALSDSVSARLAAGHTPGTTIFSVASDGERALFIGDIAHSPVQFTADDWSSVWDSDPVLANRARRMVADEASREGSLVIPAHFADLRGGVIVDDPERHFVFR